VDEPLSPREVLAWAHTFVVLCDAVKAAEFTFLNGYPNEGVAAGVAEMIRVAFPKEG